MFVEMLDIESRSGLFTSFFAETTRALIRVFGRNEDDAKKLVGALSVRFSEAPVHEQNLLLHNDPVVLAADLAEIPYANLDVGRLAAFLRDQKRSSPEP